MHVMRKYNGEPQRICIFFSFKEDLQKSRDVTIVTLGRQFMRITVVCASYLNVMETFSYISMSGSVRLGVSLPILKCCIYSREKLDPLSRKIKRSPFFLHKVQHIEVERTHTNFSSDEPEQIETNPNKPKRYFH